MFAVKQLNLSPAQSYMFLDGKSELVLMVKSVLIFLKTTVVVVTEVSDNPCVYIKAF